MSLTPGLSPSCFTLKTWWTRAIHRSYIGNYLLARIWKGADQAAADAAMFDSREGALPGFAGLKPDTQIFWCSGPIGLIHHDDFWDVVARNVRVYRRDLGFLEDNAVVLEDGEKVPADVVFCGTGWMHKYPFLTGKQVIEFGLPHSPEDDPEDVARTWESLLEIADRDVLSEFFKLKDPPSTTWSKAKYVHTIQTLQRHRPSHRWLHSLRRKPGPLQRLPSSRSTSYRDHGLFIQAYPTPRKITRSERNRIHDCVF